MDLIRSSHRPQKKDSKKDNSKNYANIAGVLICSYNIEQFTNIIDTSTIEQIGTTIISQEDGTLVSRPESVNSTNLFTFLDSINIKNKKYKCSSNFSQFIKA